MRAVVDERRVDHVVEAERPRACTTCGRASAQLGFSRPYAASPITLYSPSYASKPRYSVIAA